MTATIRSEWRKAISVKGPYWTAAGLVGILLLIAYGAARMVGPDLRAGKGASIFAFLQIPIPVVLPLSMFAFVVGTKVFTDDFRFGTMATTLLVKPQRNSVAAAKVLVGAAVGAVFGVITVVVSFGVPLAWAAISDLVLHVPIEQSLRSGAGIVLVGAIWGVLGTGVGGIMKNQVAAPISGIAWLMVVEGVVGGTWPKTLHHLPGDAAAAVALLAGNSALDAWQAGLLLAAYAAAFAAGAIVLLRSRDIA